MTNNVQHLFTTWPSMCLLCVTLSRVQLFAVPWTVAHQALLPLEFSRQEYLEEVPFPTPGDLPDPRIKLTSLASPALAADTLPVASPENVYSDLSIFQPDSLCFYLFLLLSCTVSSYILDIFPLTNTRLANIFLQSVGCLFISLMALPLLDAAKKMLEKHISYLPAMLGAG